MFDLIVASGMSVLVMTVWSADHQLAELCQQTCKLIQEPMPSHGLEPWPWHQYAFVLATIGVCLVP